MKGVRFYKVYPDAKAKRLDVPVDTTQQGECLAVYVDNRPWVSSNGEGMVDVACAVFITTPNSDCLSSSASLSYLREKCKRISEAQAEKIHPKLIEYLKL